MPDDSVDELVEVAVRVVEEAGNVEELRKEDDSVVEVAVRVVEEAGNVEELKKEDEEAITIL